MYTDTVGVSKYSKYAYPVLLQIFWPGLMAQPVWYRGFDSSENHNVSSLQPLVSTCIIH